MTPCACGRPLPDGTAACAGCGTPAPRGAGKASWDDSGTMVSAAADELEATHVAAAWVDDEPDKTQLSAAAEAATPANCPDCRSPIEPGWRFCKACGLPVAAGSARHGMSRLEASGAPGEPHPLRAGRTVVGRSEGDLRFPHDGTLSGRHAAFLVSGAGCEIVDLGSTNGTFASIRGDEPLEPGDVILVGGRRLLYRIRRKQFEIVEMLPGGVEGRRLVLKTPRAILGKDDACDMAFPEDEHVSRRHAEIVRNGERHVVRDLGSTNRTYRIVTSRRPLRDGDRVAAGAQVFEYRRL